MEPKNFKLDIDYELKIEVSMLEKDVFPKLAKQVRLRGFPFAGQWFDIGNLERYDIAKKKWEGVKVYEDVE